MLPFACRLLTITLLITATAAAEDLGELPFPLWNVVPLLNDVDDPRAAFRRPEGSLPIVVPPFVEHVRVQVPEGLAGMPLVAIRLEGDSVVAQSKERNYTRMDADSTLSEMTEAPMIKQDPAVAAFGDAARAVANVGGSMWLATATGLYVRAAGARDFARFETYGVGGPLSTDIRDLAVDSKGTLWIATSLGLNALDSSGAWRAIRGRDGLPQEDLTAIAIDGEDRLWIGSTAGLILYVPNATDRQWYYRAGERYVPNDLIHDVAVSADGHRVYTATEGGLGRLDLIGTTLLERAERIEKRVNERHRRFGLVAACTLDDPWNSTAHTIGDNDNDGLWTSYHVAAMALAYAVTRDAAAKASAKESMDALYMLQDASGIPGLVARSVVTLEEGKSKDKQWRLTPDGTKYWKSDTSSDEIDGHYMAFYTYWEHIAKQDPEEAAICVEHVRNLTDYIIKNDYQLIDWDGKRTRWGFWSPELLNDQPQHFTETGLNSLQMLSFLKTAHYITGDAKYQKHYMKLIKEHHYLANVLLEKKVYPDMDNHSDNQLAYVAWYPILQAEQDPEIREALHAAVRRHYKCLSLDRTAFFYYVTATIDPDYVDLEAATHELTLFPTDRRQWAYKNSHRADVVFNPRVDRFGKRQLMTVLPLDERGIDKWNSNVYLPDEGGSGNHEDDGAAYLLPYWMGRYHGFIKEAE
ncbi:MAG: hypothetical protein HYV27_00810 [Candidatus Hydrogenedentes bacterium]|nr:hypothetical protein [Candidatus Hydrogenedentota bacterium]